MKISILLIALSFAVSCDSNVRPIETSNSNVPAQREKPQTAIAHGPQNQTPPPPKPDSQSRWTQSGDAIDMTEYDTAVMSAEKALTAKSSDGAKKALAEAYLKRAVALTEARQYASALGDYRRTLKYDPENKEAKTWIDQITAIYTSINRAAPKEGEEPPPLPFKKPV